MKRDAEGVADRKWKALVEAGGEMRAHRYLIWLETVYIAETVRRQTKLPAPMRMARIFRLLKWFDREDAA